MSLDYIFSSKFLFEATPSPESAYYLPLIIIFGAMLISSLVVRFLKMDQKFRNKQAVAYLTLGILGFVYLGARYESLPWLGSRLYLLLVILTAIIWSIYLMVWGYKFFSKHIKESYVEERYEKYLPKQKKVKA